MNYESTYSKGIRSRSKIRFLKGLYPRGKKYLIQQYITWIARKNGATIGECVTMPYKLVKKANSNLTVGNHTLIQTDLIDLKRKVIIGSYVIIGDRVEVITGGHNIDSRDWENVGSGVEIEDYCWLATRTFILLNCNRIGRGAVVVRDVDQMNVVGGNPATHLKYRKNVHTDLVVESM